MSDSMLPMLRQLHDADGNQVRADVLLRMPDSVMLEYHEVILNACRRGGFEVGMAFVDLRISLLLAVRDDQGRAPADLAKVAEHYRETLAAFVSGGAS
ncbi:hypothetical protein [Mesorhizobium sp. B2-3-4]|uniref:hypothetical protein n=1 Tax=Mesorhizobium sp. B2-3-4 TaxID=2589959 RepID=UPI00112B6D99|nr:hypothetical protein [Mesorhizobium sp. B2-3-4]TPM41561.1 hypothetical protein FJ967_01100 [Mesorhizobium sp. B2-3-4]